MTSKRKKSNILTKEKTLKQLRREWEEGERHKKNVSKKIFNKYYDHYNEDGSNLTKINLDFIVSEKPFTEPTMDPIEKLSGLYVCPRIYVTLKERGENSKPKMIDKGVIPKILLESIISPFFKLQGVDINKITIEKNSDKPHRYDIIDESGRVIYIKLHREGKVEYTKSKTGTLSKYLENKKSFDELIFDGYIEQFKKEFDVLKTKISTEKLYHIPVLEENNHSGKEFKINLCKTPGFYGVELQYGHPNRGHSTGYSIPKHAGLSKITETIMKTIDEIESYCKLTGRAPSEIPINNKGFTNYDYFERKLKKLLKNLPDNHSKNDK